MGSRQRRRGIRPLVLAKQMRRQHDEGDLAHDRQREREQFQGADLATAGELSGAHRGKVHHDQVPGQHGDARGHQVMPEVDLRHAVEVVAGAEGNSLHAQEAHDLPPFPGDGVIEEMKPLALAQPSRRPRPADHSAHEKARRGRGHGRRVHHDHSLNRPEKDARRQGERHARKAEQRCQKINQRKQRRPGPAHVPERLRHLLQPVNHGQIPGRKNQHHQGQKPCDHLPALFEKLHAVALRSYLAKQTAFPLSKASWFGSDGSFSPFDGRHTPLSYKGLVPVVGLEPTLLSEQDFESFFCMFAPVISC